MTKHSRLTHTADSAPSTEGVDGATEIRPEPKFKVGQIVVMTGLKKELPFRIVAMQFAIGEWCYAWNRRNYAAEHMIRALNETETAAENSEQKREADKA